MIINFNVHLVRSFEEALDCCMMIIEIDGRSNKFDDSSINDEYKRDFQIHTWIGGGQLVHEKAILWHKDASEVRLATFHSKTSNDVIPGDKQTSGILSSKIEMG